MADTPVNEERFRRLSLLNTLAADGPGNIAPGRLRDLGVYGGAQGVWVDKARTLLAVGEPEGATVAILRTGRHYPDDLSDDAVIYHYPVTRRPPGRDAAEVQATKNAMHLELPVFVILPGERLKARRSVKFGWVKDFDDASRQFLILFGEVPPPYAQAPGSEEPFSLEEDRVTRVATANTRVGQQKFRFQALSRFGPKCAVCDIQYPVLLKAAHIRCRADRGSDDWRNGLPLCSTHHDAFDAHLFEFEPASGNVRCRPDILPEKIGLRQTAISTLKAKPHPDALAWRWKVTRRTWDLPREKETDLA